MSSFSCQHPHLLEVQLNNEKVIARAGSMVAYTGNIKFEKLILGGEGLFGAFKRTVTNEGVNNMACVGTGVVWFADKAQEITVIPLHGQRLCIESSALLAYDQNLRTNVVFAGVRGATSGQGLFTTTVEGQGSVAIVSDGPALALEVSPEFPVCVDPDAFLGYTGNITQEFVFDVNWRTMAGHSSGESYQLKFQGQGIVYIQPSER